MTDKYGLLDAHYFLFDCTLDGERVEDRCLRGNDIDGWADLCPVDEEGRIVSVGPVRYRGEVVFTNVRVVERHGYLAARLVEDLFEFRERVAKLQLRFDELRAAEEAKAADLSKLWAERDLEGFPKP